MSGDVPRTTAAFSIEVDADASIMRITLSGFFEAEDFRAFAQLRETRLQVLGDRPYRTFADLRGMTIQTQEIVQHFANHLRTSAVRAERVAFVVPRSLIRQQVERAMVSRAARCFLDVDEAEAWLIAADRAAA